MGAASAGGAVALVEVENSAVYNSSAAQYLVRTFGTPTDQDVWTISMWLNFRLQNDGVNNYGIFGGAANNTDLCYYAPASGQILFAFSAASGGTIPPLLRDTVGWTHFVMKMSGTSITAYYNGVQVFTDTMTVSDWNSAVACEIGTYNNAGAGSRSSMYMAETVFIDGLALEPTSFGEYDTTGLYWTPKSSTAIKALTFGNNGFYLDNTTNPQTDASGKGNNFTNTNSVGTSKNTPTNLIAKVNPLNIRNQTSLTPGTGLVLSNGNMTFDKSGGGADIMWAMDQYLIPGNKYHFEYTTDSFDSSSYARVATWIGPASYYDSGVSFFGAETAVYRDSYIRVGGSGSNQNYFNNSALTTATITPTTGTRITYEVDMSTIGSTTIRIYEDGVLDITYSSLAFADEPYSLGFWTGAETDRNGQVTVNFDSSSFEDTPTTGYIGLSTNDVASATDRTASDTNKYFQTTLYEGNGAGQRVGAFQPFDNTFTVAKSALFNVANSEYFSRTFETPTDQDVWTLSWWMKTGNLAAGRGIIGSAASNSSFIYINNVKIYIVFNGTTAFNFLLDDASQWYNIILTCNGSTLTCYVNGVSRGTASVAMNDFNSAVAHTIGSYNGDESHFDGYMADFIFVDGTVHSTSVFGQTDTSTNRWIPKDPTITLDEASDFGNNGFYLNFADSSALGDDISGNNHDFTNNNTVTQSTDSPTTNLAVLNANFTNATLLNGNRTSDAGSGNCTTRVTIPMTTGKFYWEGGADAQDSTNATPRMGIGNLEQAKNVDMGNSAKTTWAYNMSTNSTYYGKTIFGATQTGSAVSFTTSQVAQFAYDADAGKFWVGKDNTWLFSGDPATGANPTYEGIEGPIFPCVQDTGTSKSTIAIAEADWTYSAPTDFVALAQDNLAGTDQFISAFSWIKNRDAEDNHMLFDRVRGATKDWHSNTTDAEAPNVNTVQRFLEAGVQVGNDVEVNTANESYVLWNWMMENTGSGASNEDGTINTTATLVDQTLGMSVSTYTGTGANATIGHGLEVAPTFVIIKRLTGAGYNPTVAVNSGDLNFSKRANLDTTGIFAASSTFFQDTNPSPTVITLGSNSNVNASSVPHVCYAFAPSQFISIGSYEGNANPNGAFVPTLNSLGVPLQPVWAIFKDIDAAYGWGIYDIERNGYNGSNSNLMADATTVEGTTFQLDIVSGGIKMRHGSGVINTSNTYVYMAIGTPIIDVDGRIIAGR